MEFVGYTILITLSICVIIVIIARLTKSQQVNVTNNEEKSIALSQVKIDKNDKEGQLVLKIQKMFNENVSLALLEIYVKLGMPEDIAYSKNKELIDEYLDLKKNIVYKELFDSYCWAIKERYNLQNQAIVPIDHNQYNLNLNNNETLYYRINLTSLYEEKVTRRNITYSGVRWNNNMMRAGTLSLVSQEIKNFVIQDNGRLYITDKRLIFIGKQKNVTKTISLSSIITYYLYQDGILILQGNKNGILLKFEEFNDFMILQDGINEFTTVVSRILSENHNVNLLNSETIENKDSKIIFENVEINKQTFDEQFIEVANFVVINKEVSPALIQRKFLIGYNRAERLINELERLNIVSNFDGVNPRKVNIDSLDELHKILGSNLN
jgi:hypothetical protein